MLGFPVLGFPVQEIVKKKKKLVHPTSPSLLNCISVNCVYFPLPYQSMKRGEAKRHADVCSVFHLSKLLTFALDLEKKVKSAFTDSSSGELSEIAHFNPEYQLSLTGAISKIDSVFDEVKDIQQKLCEQSTRISSLEARIRSHGNDSIGATSTFRSLGPNVQTGMLPDELSRRLINLENRTADHEVLICESGQNQSDAMQQFRGLQRQLEAGQETIRRLERKVGGHDHSLALRNVALAELEECVRQQQVSSYDGVLLWKITDYKRKRDDALSGRKVSFHSPCFHTGTPGYKMCVRIFPVGDGVGKGTHISVFLMVMPGQFDEQLPWPFRKKVTIMLLDYDNEEHVTDTFRPDPNSSSFQRPRGEMNIASGCPKFCALTELNRHAYVRDDTMEMKVICCNSSDSSVL